MEQHKRDILFTVRLIIAIGLMLFVLIPHARGTEIEVSLSPGISSYKADTIKPAHSYKLTVLQNGFYLAGEQENFNIYGQDMSINGLSLGYRYQINPHIFVYGQAGYYRPDYASRGFGREAAYTEMARQYGYSLDGTMPWMDRYEVNFKPDFGAEVGIGVKQPIYGGLSIDLSLGYRYLRMWADYDGYRTVSGVEELGWIMSRSDCFDAVKVYGGVSYEF